MSLHDQLAGRPLRSVHARILPGQQFLSPNGIVPAKKLYPSVPTVDVLISPEANEAGMMRNVGKRMDDRSLPIRNSAPNLILKPNLNINAIDRQQ